MEVSAGWWLHPNSDKQYAKDCSSRTCSNNQQADASLRISTSPYKRKHQPQCSVAISKVWPVQAAALKLSTAQTAQVHDQGVLLDTHVPEHFDALLRVPDPITPAVCTRPWPDWNLAAEQQPPLPAHDWKTPHSSVLLSPVQQTITAKAVPVVQMVERCSNAAVARYQDRLCYFREVLSKLHIE
jgi:hypothetical protein